MTGAVAFYVDAVQFSGHQFKRIHDPANDTFFIDYRIEKDGSFAIFNFNPPSGIIVKWSPRRNASVKTFPFRPVVEIIAGF